ncbi:MAG: lysophospholipid acyltransferase family protein [Proteobacteria bacterium]|nr:lysophospholipid acyltransferase family protein [Pseudomonadota bacterium]
MSIKQIKYFLLLSILPPLIYIIISFIKVTSQIKHISSEPAHEMWDKGKNSIVCFWHGRLLMMPFANRRGKGKVLISRHRDGEFIARVMRYFSLGAVRGSYRKEGGISSLREIISDLKKGYDVAITPDGPKGPKYVVKKGIIELAKITGKAIVPISYSASKKKLFIPGTALLSPVPFQKFCFSGESRFL